MLLSGLIRQATVTGRTDYISSWLGERQGGRWAEQTVRAAMPNTAPRPRPPAPPRQGDPAGAMRLLTELHQRGAVDDAEFARLSADLTRR